MNCFRFVSLKYWTQLAPDFVQSTLCCELLSICIFEILNTTKLWMMIILVKLWIAFDLYLWNIEHNHLNSTERLRCVVNCFRFVSLKYWTQLLRVWGYALQCCELLSICIFEILNTTLNLSINPFYLLWIAFDLYLWNIEHNLAPKLTSVIAVVNCFRFVSLKYWTQLSRIWQKMSYSCELLSICIFEILNTTQS